MTKDISENLINPSDNENGNGLSGPPTEAKVHDFKFLAHIPRLPIAQGDYEEATKLIKKVAMVRFF